MEDLISRQAVLDALNNIEIPRNASWYQYYQHALTAVDKLPSAEPKQVKSRWEPVQIWYKGRVCMECGTVFEKVDIGNGKANFCPYCGADMRGEQE